MLITKRHNKVVWELRKLGILKKIKTLHTYKRRHTQWTPPRKHKTNMATAPHMRCPKMPLQPRSKPNILCVIGHLYNHPPLEAPTLELTNQFLKYTYYNDWFVAALNRITTKYQLLIKSITIGGWWNVAPLMVLAACARATTHIVGVCYNMLAWESCENQ